MKKIFRLLSLAFLICASNFAQSPQELFEVKTGELGQDFTIDGYLNEEFWSAADAISDFTMVEPVENNAPTFKTIVKVAANESDIVIGIICYDDSPAQITAFSKARDSELQNEDFIKILLDTYKDQRTGYIFAVNPLGARYDALVASRGERESSNWDAIWEAASAINSDGWSAEIRIPIKAISYGSGLKSWGFNVERYVNRLLERDRWSGAKQDYKISHSIKAGLLTGLPEFSFGTGTTIRTSMVGHNTKNFGEKFSSNLDASLDINQKITSDINVALTINTDFAETEVDTRRTNLTRFPLRFPEKRTFFLEGAGIFDFGLGLRRDLEPFFTRRIGLNSGREIPINAGAKINGKINDTYFGALLTNTAAVDTVAPSTTMGAFRVKQNIFKQSNIGVLGTFGDPNGLKQVWMIGADFTYQTTEFLGNKNFLFGVWGLHNNREDLTGSKSAFGLRVDYPNDLWDASFTLKYFGDGFNPSTGYLRRNGIKSYSTGIRYQPRPESGIIRQLRFHIFGGYTTTLDNHWDSYGFYLSPLTVNFESGDRLEFNIRPQGEKLPEDFEVSDGVVIVADEYHWTNYRLELTSSEKRMLSGSFSYLAGGFYNGDLTQIQVEVSLKPTSNLIFELNFEDNEGALPAGQFTQTLWGLRAQINFSPDLQLTSFFQFDNESNELGSNTRLRWTFDPLGDLFVVYNHNINKFSREHWQFDSNQLILKLSYGLWF